MPPACSSLRGRHNSVYKVQPSPQCERPHDETSCALGHARRDFGLAASAKQKKLDALDEARRVGGAAEHVAGAVQVPEGEGQLHRLAVEEIHPGGQRNAADPRGRRGESRQRAWEILNRFSALDIVGVARGQLVVEAGDELVVDGLRHLLHHFTLCSFRFARLTKGVEGRLGSEGSPLAAGLAADPGLPDTGMGTLFRPKGVCACGLGRLAGRLRICGSGRFLGSLSDSVSILKTSGWLRWALRCSWMK